MSAPSFQPRRRFITGLVATLASFFGPGFVPTRGRNIPVKPGDALLALFDDPRIAEAIGAAFLCTLAPSERSREQLTAAICADAALAEGEFASLDLGRRIGDRVRRDFARGTMVQVDGWFLSLTEARLYALAATV